MSELDTKTPHGGRVWNYFLGGNDNYKADQEAGEAYKALFPEIEEFAQASRAFLRRTATFMTKELGLDQFFDVGSGLPAEQNTHEVVQGLDPTAKIVYSDLDTLVNLLVHSHLRSTREGVATYFQADMRDTDALLEGVSRTLDLSRPVGVIFSDCLGHIRDEEDPWGVVSRLTRHLTSGSYLMVSHASDTNPRQVEAQRVYNAAADVPYVLRPVDRIARFFDGMDMVDPGLVPWRDWKPDEFAGTVTSGYGAVARIR